MKILIVNYRYFVSGGPERYMFNLISELNTRGHQVVPFSINYSKNLPTEYQRYFVEPLGSRDEILFREQKTTFTSMKRTLQRLFYDSGVEQAIGRLISDTQPQIAYVLHFARKLSPAVLVGIKNKGLPIVARISDYGLLCPGVHCSRDGQPCILCVTGNLLPSVRYKCIQKSWIASSLNALAIHFHRLKGFYNLIDRFVVTNDFMYDMMRMAGYPASRLLTVPTFVKSENAIQKNITNIPVIVIVGRVERIKGVHVLLRAVLYLRRIYPTLQFSVKIAGVGNPKYMDELKNYIVRHALVDRVEFLGELSYNELSNLFESALISVIPSVIYENLPNSLLESFSFGTPVVASNIGSLAYVIKDHQNGLKFEPNNAIDLAEKIKYCIEHPALVQQMGENAKYAARRIFSPGVHVKKLINLFEDLIKEEQIE